MVNVNPHSRNEPNLPLARYDRTVQASRVGLLGHIFSASLLIGYACGGVPERQVKGHLDGEGRDQSHLTTAPRAQAMVAP